MALLFHYLHTHCLYLVLHLHVHNINAKSKSHWYWICILTVLHFPLTCRLPVYHTKVKPTASSCASWLCTCTLESSCERQSLIPWTILNNQEIKCDDPVQGYLTMESYMPKVQTINRGHTCPVMTGLYQPGYHSSLPTDTPVHICSKEKKTFK